ncbi:unnamed protein product [Caenorhabditis auriculariae]|uniref:Uncharacterized protein n=1 Tax=Caenorhabditis auriculariae TaxID=2777116 RepID=A0A8S1GZZ9_9PELO|nr:unnamed protein product [Caenorhabditis auriculariae]
MTVSRSYSPNGIIRPNPDYDLCCGLFHSTSAAKFFSIAFFASCLLISGVNFMWFGADKGWISLFCLFFTIYSSILVYGVFLEKPLCLLPCLVIQGIFTVFNFLFIIFLSLYGAFSDVIKEHHAANEPLRDLYKMHSLDPDNDKTQTIVSSAFLFSLIAIFFISTFSWYAIFRAMQCYKENQRTYLPGYQPDIVATNNSDYDI